MSQPADRRSRAGSLAGFTLLELLVVLSILGLVTAMAAPAVLRSIDSWRRQAQVDVLVEQVRGLPAQARSSGRTIEISDETLAGDPAPLKIDEGWRLATPHSWRVHANGVCESGALHVHSDSGRSEVLLVKAPFCDVEFGGPG